MSCRARSKSIERPGSTKNKMAILRAFPRLHIGLLDLGQATPRKYGGAGFSLDGYPIEIHANMSAKKTTIGGLDELDAVAREQISLVIHRFQSLVPNCQFDINFVDIPSQHIGFGTKTALLLGVLKALDCAAGSALGDSTLQQLSGRGGTSGIGVNAFFRGGFIVDLGHPAQGGNDAYGPSSVGEPLTIPPVACRLDIPPNWNFDLILADGRMWSGAREVRFFKETTPISKDEVFESISVMYHGVLPAVMENRLAVLRQSVDRLHEIGFKGKELAAQTDLVRRTYTALRTMPNCVVGLSSLGPLLYVISEGTDANHDVAVADVCSSSPSLLHLGKVHGRNTGFEVSVV
jgi:beta-ribofuranosylaminobenzene 5'-phosphate synthase